MVGQDYNYRRRSMNVPFFMYYDLHYADLHLGYTGFIGFAGQIDFYLGAFMLNIGGDIKWVEEYVAPEAGISLILSQELRLKKLRQFAAGRNIVGYTRNHVIYRTWTWENDYVGLALDLHLLDLGVKIISKHISEDTGYENGSATVYGQNFTGVDYIKYESKGTVFYLGYRYMPIRQKAMTIDEIIFSARFLIGSLERTATVWDWNTEQVSGTVSKGSETVYGFELAMGWNMISAKLGYFDSKWYFGLGFRIGFQTGL